MSPETLLKKKLKHRCFPVNFAKFLRTPFLQNMSGRLLLECISIQMWGENIFNMIHDLLISLHKIQSFPLRISKANLTGFYMMTASVMKELSFMKTDNFLRFQISHLLKYSTADTKHLLTLPSTLAGMHCTKNEDSHGFLQ